MILPIRIPKILILSFEKVVAKRKLDVKINMLEEKLNKISCKQPQPIPVEYIFS